jgi:hypothetical protein
MALETIWLSVLAEKPRLANSVPVAKTHQNIQKKEGGGGKKEKTPPPESETL